MHTQLKTITTAVILCMGTGLFGTGKPPELSKPKLKKLTCTQHTAIVRKHVEDNKHYKDALSALIKNNTELQEAQEELATLHQDLSKLQTSPVNTGSELTNEQKEQRETDKTKKTETINKQQEKIAELKKQLALSTDTLAKTTSKATKDAHTYCEAIPTYSLAETAWYHCNKNALIAWQWIKTNPSYAIAGGITTGILAICYFNHGDNTAEEDYDYDDE